MKSLASGFPAASRAAPRPQSITGVVLAGGRGSRMGGEDKGLVALNGRAMVEHVIARLRPQVGQLLISANRNHARYAAFGYSVVPDLLADYQGPLAGMAAALQAATTPYVVTVPCDSPLMATDVVDRLAQALVREDAEVSVAHDGSRTHPVFLMVKRALLPSLLEFLDAGERKIDRWFARHRVALADFRDCPESFVNVNDPGEHRSLEAQLRERSPC
jgi:molybdenum cofactor guanylyltransferase